MAISSLRFPLSPWLLLKTPKLKPSFRFSFPILPSSRHTQLLLLCSYSQSPPSISPPLTDSNSNQSLHSKWESIRKKKVALRVGYVGTDYRGLFPETIFSFLVIFLIFLAFYCFFMCIFCFFKDCFLNFRSSKAT